MIRGSRHIFVIALMGLCVTLYAQSSYESRKMSSLVREAARSTSIRKAAGYEEEAAPHICALVRRSPKSRRRPRCLEQSSWEFRRPP